MDVPNIKRNDYQVSTHFPLGYITYCLKVQMLSALSPKLANLKSDFVAFFLANYEAPLTLEMEEIVMFKRCFLSGILSNFFFLTSLHF